MADCAISVIVPTHQRRERVLALARALDRQTFPASDFELAVTVDGSTDGTGDALAALSPRHALHVSSQPQRGRAAALNAAISRARGTLLILLDDDMEPAPGFLAAHWRAHEGRARHGVMGAVPVPTPPGMRPATRYVADKFNGHLARLAQPGAVLRLTDFYSGNFSIHRSVLDEVGGFDEDFRAYGNEDLEFSFRLRQAGVSLVYDPDALAVQHNDKDFPALARDAAAEGRTAVLFALKHPAAFADLKLASYSQGPVALRMVRNLLLAVNRWWPGFPDWLLRGETHLARLVPNGLSTFYRLALGYMFWTGVRAALAARLTAGPLDPPLARLARRLRL
jgi:GT2 family glycosyltransferase